MAAPRSILRRVVGSALLVTAVVSSAAAPPLLERSGHGPAAAPGIARVETLRLDRGTLASLRTATTATLDAFPLGADATTTLVLERFDPFSADARVDVVGPAGARAIPLPDQRYFRGTIPNEPTARALLVAGVDEVHGFVATRGTVFRFGRDRQGIHRGWALRDVDTTRYPGPGAFCRNTGAATRVGIAPNLTGAPSLAAPPPTAAFSPTLLAEVAIETDQELLARFGGDTTATLAYLADLVAAVSAIYDADTDVRVRFSYVRLWETTDPWTASSVDGLLGAVRSYWMANEGATPRDVVHFVSGRPVTGGVAYVDVLCDASYGYGVSTVYGAFDVMNPNDTWDVVVVAHELGHNFGSDHTHCYAPPIDNCYGEEPGCYTGPESLPPGGGTVMSYCHLLAGGMANISLTFGATVSGVLRNGAEDGVCIGVPCGDGVLDPGEACDDGNDVGGDCCSPSCAAEPDGGACDDGEACTAADQCAAGACGGTPVPDGTGCDDGSACTADACSAGACVGTPLPAVGCKVPTLPQRAQLLLKDRTPDTSDQLAWKWSKGQATTVAEFGAPTTSDDYELCIYTPGPTLLFSARMPAGGTCGTVPCWSTLPGKGYRYADKERTPDGMSKLALAAGAEGTAKISLKGKGTLLAPPALGGLATPIDVQLRGAGGCWEATFSAPTIATSELFKAISD